jgi:hypothetical protein
VVALLTPGTRSRRFRTCASLSLCLRDLAVCHLRSSPVVADTKLIVLSRDGVTVDGVGLVIRFLGLLNTIRDCTLQITIIHRLVLSVTVFTALLGSGFQQWTFPFLCAHALIGWQTSSQSYVTTAPRPAFCYCRTVAGLMMWVAVSDERTDL